MKTKHLLCISAVTLFMTWSARALIPVPVWEYLINHPNLPVPAMTNFLNDVTDSDAGDGKSVLDTIGPLRRYDANRLLLGIRENGVNESAGNLTAGQLWVSTNYPDRSLIWINPTNGLPMGIALTIGLYPVPLDDWFISNSIAATITDYTNQYYWSFDVSDDGYVYTGYKNKVLRYAPDGSGGISPVPQVVFTLQPTNNDAAVHGNLYTTAGSFPQIRVRGTGVNAVILAGGMSGTRGAYRLATTNGTDFFATCWLPGGWGNAGSGSFSDLIPALDPTQPGEEWVYGGWFPGSSSGADSKHSRMLTASPYVDPANNFIGAGTFNVQGDTTSPAPRYTGSFTGTVGAKEGTGWIVAYQTPSWNSLAVNGGKYDPGFLAVEDATNGTFIASYQLQVRESDALLTTDGASKWEGTYGWVELNSLPSGDTECLWSSGLYGYGRYLMKPFMKITSIEAFPGSSVTIMFTGDGSAQLQRATSLDPSAVWQDVGPVTPLGQLILDLSPPAGAAYYRLKMVP